MNSGNIKISYRHRLLFNLLDKINLKRKDKYVALSDPSIYHPPKPTPSYTPLDRQKSPTLAWDADKKVKQK